jgi:outer membrane protein OmpA-like peptidoglycan-associated protein/outer membrane protein W
MKKNIILSLVLFVSLAFVSVYGQDENSTVETSEDSIEGSVDNLFGPRKGDFTGRLLLGKGSYFNGLNIPTDANGAISPNTPSALVSGNNNSAVNMIGVEMGYYLSNRWALTLTGGTILSITPSQLGIPAAGGLPEYAAVIADGNIDVNVTVGAQYLFKTESKKLFPFIGVSVPYNYARRSVYDPTINLGAGGITDLGVGHTETNSFGIQAVAGVDYYFTEEIFMGVRIVPMAYNYAYSSTLPRPGLPVLESDNSSASFFVQPSISLGFNFGKRDRDRDGDGILDKDDACPDVAGEVGGCPPVEPVDTDGDGVTDDIDRCPYNAGPSETWGCPDYDKDGVLDLDEDDLCPGIAGPKENNGCPWPDTDGDGVLDKDDKCIDVVGSADNGGCPLIDESSTNLIDDYAKMILFQTGKSSFQNGITSNLDEIAIIMNDYPKAKFLIEGHTDNIGSTSSNQLLSEERASTVLNYLTSTGNVASDRLFFVGRGELNPGFDNNTSEGRKINRRVLVITRIN